MPSSPLVSPLPHSLPYAMQLRECRARIEDAALATEPPDRRLAPIIRDRIEELQAMLARIEEEHDAHRSTAGGKR